MCLEKQEALLLQYLSDRLDFTLFLFLFGDVNFLGFVDFGDSVVQVAFVRTLVQEFLQARGRDWGLGLI